MILLIGARALLCKCAFRWHHTEHTFLPTVGQFGHWAAEITLLGKTENGYWPESAIQPLSFPRNKGISAACCPVNQYPKTASGVWEECALCGAIRSSYGWRHNNAKFNIKNRFVTFIAFLARSITSIFGCADVGSECVPAKSYFKCFSRAHTCKI